MRIIYRLATVLTFFLFSGCLDFGKNEQTASPTERQIDNCRSKMYLNPSMKITALGYKLEGSGIDDAIWFKFKTDVTRIGDIFDSQVINTNTFKKGFNFIHDLDKVKWWDTKSKKLSGAQIALPETKFMNIGIEKLKNGYLVYVMWHEV